MNFIHKVPLAPSMWLFRRINSIISISAHRKWPDMVVSASNNQVWAKITIRSYAWSFDHSDPDPSNFGWYGCIEIAVRRYDNLKHKIYLWNTLKAFSCHYLMIAKKSQLMLNRVKEGREQDFSFLFCKGHYFRQPLLESSCGQVVRDFESEAKTRCNFQFR